MRNILRVTIILLSSFYCNAQELSKQIGGLLSEISTQMEIDNKGNIYLTGSFQGDISLNSNKIKSFGGSDIFLAKFDNKGTNIWIKNAGSNSNPKYLISETGSSLTLVNDKYIYVAGNFSDSANFSGQKIVSNGLDDIFICKYDHLGNLIWAKSAGGLNQDFAYSISHDKYENIYIVGSFQHSAKFENKVVQAKNETEMFVAKYNSEGNLIWIKQSESTSNVVAKTIDIIEDNVYISGIFNDQFQYDSNELKSKGESDIFIINISTEGNFKWIKQIGGKGDDNIEDIKATNKNLYLAGSFSKEIGYNDLILKSNGSKDILCGKMDIEGNIEWLTNIGGMYKDEAYDLDIDNNENILVCGYFQGKLMNTKNAKKTSEGFTDAFYASLNQSGEINFIETLGGLGQDIATSIITKEDEICLTGFFYENLNFKNEFLTSKGRSDIFLFNTKHKLAESTEKIEELNSTGIEIYPNPTHDFIKITSTKPISYVKLINSSGSVVKSFELQDIYNYQFSVEELPIGNYIIEIITNKNIFKEKVIVI